MYLCEQFIRLRETDGERELLCVCVCVCAHFVCDWTQREQISRECKHHRHWGNSLERNSSVGSILRGNRLNDTSLVAYQVTVREALLLAHVALEIRGAMLGYIRKNPWNENACILTTNIAVVPSLSDTVSITLFNSDSGSHPLAESSASYAVIIHWKSIQCSRKMIFFLLTSQCISLIWASTQYCRKWQSSLPSSEGRLL